MEGVAKLNVCIWSIPSQMVPESIKSCHLTSRLIAVIATFLSKVMGLQRFKRGLDSDSKPMI